MSGLRAVMAGIPRPPVAVSLLLAGSLCLLPFLLPYHQLPVLSFQAEWLAASLGVAAMLAALVSGNSNAIVPMPVPARWLAAFVLFLAAQALSGNSNYPQLPLLEALYVLDAVLLVWLGAQLTASAGIERAASTLAAFLLVGALANAAAGMIQFYGRPALLEDLVAVLHRGSGAYGNIAQPNLYANYLALGGTALLFLWQQRRLRATYAVAAALLLAWASALSGSRSALLYVLWFTALALPAGRIGTGTESKRLKFAAYGVAGMMLAAQLAIPWANEAFSLGPANPGAFERLVAISKHQTEARWPAWLLALRVFAATPITGAGAGEFAGAAFELGLSPEMAAGEVWTSPHNLPLHLLAETGIAGALLVLTGLCIWCWQTWRRHVLMPQPALWWIIAAAGIELVHSMVEFPLWNAHFLGVTAIVMGLGTKPRPRSGAVSRLWRALAAGLCAMLALTLAMVLKDYLRLDATHITGTSLTLGGTTDRDRDIAIMNNLTRGPLAPVAELWIFLGMPLDRGDLAARVAMSGRVVRYFPANAVVVRRVVFLAFDGQTAEARRLLLHALRSFPHRCNASALILEKALAADRANIEPLLTLVREAAKSNCS